ncbi:hypothetical protein ABPG74_009704 [Tetrahymena malaccensis]
MLNQNTDFFRSTQSEQAQNQNQTQNNSKIPLIIRIANSSNDSTPNKRNSFLESNCNEVINLCEQEIQKKEIRNLKPKKQIDCIVLQNELNYFEDDEQEEFKNDKKQSQKPQKIGQISQQNKINPQEQYYNPIILADNTKYRERQMQNQRNQQRNNSLESKFLEKSNNQLIQESNHNQIRQQNYKNNSYNFIKVDSCQQLEMENIQNSSSDSFSEVQQNKNLTKINQQYESKKRNNLLQNQNVIQNQIQTEQSISQSQIQNRNNLIQVKNQIPLLPPIHPQKTKQSHQQVNNDQSKKEIKTYFIRKSRSNSFTEEKNIFKTNLDRNQRVSSSEFKNLLNNVNFQQIQKNISRNQKAITQISEQNYNVIEYNSTNGIKNPLKKNDNIQQNVFQRSQFNKNIRKEQQSNQSIERYQVPLIIQQPELEFIQERQNNIINYPNQERQQANSQRQIINSRSILQNQEDIRQANERQQSRDVIRLQNQNNRNQKQQRNNNNNEQRYNDIIQRRNQINAQQENLNDQFQSRQNIINQNPPPRFMIDNMYDQFIEFQNQLRQHQGVKSDKYVSTTVYKSSQSQNLSQDAKQCSICLCEFEDEEKISFLACFHRFHNECIHKWFETKSTCPLCKKDQKTLIKDVNKLLDEF